MNPDFFPRAARTFSALVFCLALAGCFGTGDGPEPIAGTPAPPDSGGGCDPNSAEPDGNSPFPLNFEQDPSFYDFGAEAGFGGGATVVVANDVCSMANPTPQAARAQKFAAEPFGGSTLQLNTPVDFTLGEVFTMQVWSQRSVPVTFKFDDASEAPDSGIGLEVVESHSGSGEWETLCFDFSNVLTPGFGTQALTLIFDNGVVGNADNDPDNWTFYLDKIEQVAACPGAPTTTLPVDFEDDPATYQFANFAGGVADVIANPDQSGINTTAQTARMVKDGGEVFGGSTLALADNFDFAQGSAFRMKVWSNRGSAVPVLFKLEDAVTGLPENGIESTQDHTGGGTWEELCFDFGAATNGFVSDSITFIFDISTVGDATNDPDAWTFYFDEIEQVANCTGAPPPPPATFSTLTFDDAGVTYTLRGFGGAEDSTVVADPDDASNNVVQVNRSATAETFAGTVVSTLANEAVGVIPLDASNTEMTMRVRSPAPGIPVRLKIENAADAAISVETEVLTTVANAWETLTFDFSNEVSGTSAFDPAATYDKIAVFFNFGTDGATAGAQTFFFDDVSAGTAPPPPAFETITFDDAAVTYALRGFGGAEDSTVVADPEDAANNVVQVNRSAAAETFAGTVVSTGANESVPDIPLDAMNTVMSVRVYAPAAGIPVRLKIEDASNAAVSVETEATTTVANGWETLTFDFANEVSGTTAFDPAATYNKIALFFNFGTDGATAGAQTFFFDDIRVGLPPAPMFEAITFDDMGVTYALRGFGGAEDSTIQPDPTAASNNVVRVNRSAAAETFAGTVVSTGANESVIDIPLDAMSTQMSVRVYAPAAGIPVRLKIEDASNAAVSVETEATTTIANGWETLVFDFSNEVSGTPAFDPAATYNKIALFFNFGTDGATAGAQTFFFDTIAVGDGTGPGFLIPATIDFESPSGLGPFFNDFGGGQSSLEPNPDTGGINPSAQALRLQKFPGETFGGSTILFGGNATADFSSGENFLIKVYATRPVDVLFKLEGPNLEQTVAHGGTGWELLCFDFTGNAAGTTVNGYTFIFDNGTQGAADTNPDDWTFYVDDIEQTTNACPAPAPTFETITFDDPGTTYTLEDFGGNASTITNDPMGGMNMVVQAVRSNTAETFAGTTVSTLPGSQIPEPLSAGNLVMTVRVYSPEAGVTVRLKIEDAADPGIFVETDASTTVVNTWETLTFDFGSPVSTPYDDANTYNKLSIFFNFGAQGSVVGEQIYFFDDIALAPPPPMFEAITFDDSGVSYALRGFGGAEDSSIQADPVVPSNNVVQVNRSATAETFAGTVVSTGANESVPDIPLDTGSTQMSVRVYAPAAGIPVRLKVEDATNAAVSVETEVMTTVANDWETLTFDFANEVSGTPAFDPGATYNKIAIFFNFGTDGATAGAQTFFFDDIDVGGAAPPPPAMGELAVNGGFEAGDLSGWTFFDNGGTAIVTMAEASEGTFSVNAVAAQGQSPTLKQEFLAAGTVTPGQTVNISFDMKGTAGAGGVIFPELISEGDMGSTGELLETIAVPEANFRTYSYTATAGADVTRGITFQIAVVCGGVSGCFADVFIDNVSVTLDSGT